MASRRTPLFLGLLVVPLFVGLYFYFGTDTEGPSIHPFQTESEIWIEDPTTAHQQVAHLKRLSSEALKSQGAKSHFKENLMDDKNYLISMLGAG